MGKGSVGVRLQQAVGKLAMADQLRQTLSAQRQVVSLQVRPGYFQGSVATLHLLLLQAGNGCPLMQPCRHSLDSSIRPHPLRQIRGVCRDNKHQGWQQLAGLFLSITGAEALYADLGHFNKTAIRVKPGPGLVESLLAAGGLCCC